MRIQYCSDLHLEFKENKNFLTANPLTPVGDILILAGDIIPFALMDAYQDFFDYLSDNFMAVYWLPGNHEYYHSDIKDRSGKLNEKIRENFFLVNNTSVVQGNTKLIFSTLWSAIRPDNEIYIRSHVNDFRLIKYFGESLPASVFNRLHTDCKSFIESELAVPDTTNTVVVTHHVPSLHHYPEKYKNDILNEVFAVELYDLIARCDADYWVYGHHHCNVPGFNIGKAQLITNQLGYLRYDEHHLFQSDACINLSGNQ